KEGYYGPYRSLDSRPLPDGLLSSVAWLVSVRAALAGPPPCRGSTPGRPADGDEVADMTRRASPRAPPPGGVAAPAPGVPGPARAAGGAGRGGGGARPAGAGRGGARHVKVYAEPGRFGGWPANHGLWAWGDEILVGFSAGYARDNGPGRHAIDHARPEEHLLARSRNGGETWAVEDPAAQRTPGPAGKAPPRIPP